MNPIQLDIPKILHEKAPHARVPDFLVRYLQRITHETNINEFLARHSEDDPRTFLDATLREKFGTSTTVTGLENIPTSDASLIFISNHPLGGMDGMMIAAALLDARGLDRVKVIVNDMLMYLRPLAPIFVPVNKVGAQSKEYVRRYEELWESGVDILTFPAGACSRLQWIRGGFHVEDLEWKKSFVIKAQQFRRDVMPIYFEGYNSHRFYALAFWRKLLGIKVNIEMLYLVDEMFRAKGKHFRIHIDKRIPWQTFDKSKSPAQWADWCRELVYKIR